MANTPSAPSGSGATSASGVPVATSPTRERIRRSVQAASSVIDASPTPTDRRVRLVARPLSPGEWQSIGSESGAILVDHDVHDERLLVRLVPSVTHNLAAGTLLVNLDSALARLGLRGAVTDLGSSSGVLALLSAEDTDADRVIRAGCPLTASRFKEADGELCPQSRLDRGLNIPSFVVEVGVGESPEILAEDGRAWLLSSRTSDWVRAVLTVSIDPHPNRPESCQIRVQILTNRRRLTPSGRQYRLKLESTITWRSGQGAWPGPLRLPARYFLDLLQWPPELPEDAVIEIDGTQMTTWAETIARIWQVEVTQRRAGGGAGSSSR